MKDDVSGGRLLLKRSVMFYFARSYPHRSLTLQITGDPLKRRADDNVESLKTRLSAYHNQTAPLAGFYREKGILTTIDAAQKSDKVYQTIRQALLKPGKADRVKFV